MIRLGEPENVENLEKSQLRPTLLQTSEFGLRNVLRQCQVNFEVSDVQEKIRVEKQKTIGINQELIDSLN